MELGSAIGFLGLYCLKRLEVRRFASVEANPETGRQLCSNYTINNITPEYYNIAISDHDGHTSFGISGDFWVHSIHQSTESSEQLHIPCKTLRSICLEISFQPTVIVIDIEGSENLIAFSEVPPTVRLLIIELHPLILSPRVTHQIIQQIMNLGFLVIETSHNTFCFERSALSANCN